MYPGMVFLILSLDPGFVSNMSALLRSNRQAAYVATSWREVPRLQLEISFEMLIVGPYFRVEFPR